MIKETMIKESAAKWRIVIENLIRGKVTNNKVSESSIEDLCLFVEETNLSLFKTKNIQDNKIREIEDQLPIILNSIVDTMVENKLEFRHITKDDKPLSLMADVIVLISIPYTNNNNNRLLPSDSNITSRTKDIQVALKNLLTTKFSGTGTMELCSIVLFLSDANNGVGVCAGIRYIKNNIIDSRNIVHTSKQPKLKFQKLSKNAITPVRGTLGSSGLDVFSPIDSTVPKMGDVLIPLDLRFEIPFGWDLSVYNKSGIATKKKLFKGAELIDSDYRGTVHIHLFNHSDADVKIKKGDKISQLVMRQVWMGDIEESDNISIETQRSTGGFGSTGN